MLIHYPLKILIPCFWFITVVKMSNEIECSKCPGSYCGRTMISNTSDCNTPCVGCERGHRSDSYFCLKCQQNLHLYDWLFLGFMALCVTVSNFYAIDTFHSSHRKVWILHLSALLESILSFIIMVLSFEPYGELQLWTCGVSSMKDWYTVFFNPKVNYILTIHCTQEAVYPLFTAVLIYLLFSFLLMLLFRGVILRLVIRNFGRSPLYVGFYTIPIVATIHTCLGGVIYYIFPYLACILSAIGVALFLSTLDNGYFNNIRRPRHIGVLVCYAIAHGFGIVSITEMKVLERDAPVLLLIFLPFCFYTITRPFTDAENFKV